MAREPCKMRGKNGRGPRPTKAGVKHARAVLQPEHQGLQTGRGRGLQGALQLGAVGQGRPDRHAQPRHAGRGRGRRRPHQARQDLRAGHPAGPERPAARAVRQALEPDPHHAGHRHRRAGRPAAAARLRRRRHQHADPVGHALGFAGPYLLRRQDVQRARCLQCGLQRPRHAGHRARQGQAGGPRGVARHRPLQGRGHPGRRLRHLQRRARRLRRGAEGRDPHGRLRIACEPARWRPA